LYGFYGVLHATYAIGLLASFATFAAAHRSKSPSRCRLPVK